MERISLINKAEIITKNKDLSKIFNNFFGSVEKMQGIENWLDNESNLPNVDDPILKVIA